MKNRSVSIAALAFIILAALFVLAVMVRDYQIRVRDKAVKNLVTVADRDQRALGACRSTLGHRV